MNMVVLVPSKRDALLELVSAAEGLERRIAAVVPDPGWAEGYVDKIYRIPKEISNDKLVAALAGMNDVDVFLIYADRNGKEIAARLGARLGTSCYNDCSSIDKNLEVERMAYGGKGVARILIKAKPAVVSIKPRAYKPKESPGRSSDVEDLPIPEVEERCVIKSVEEKELGAVDLTKAERIVSVGRGLKKKEDLKMIEELAQLLNAAVGCSRPIAADLKWLPEGHHVGMTGVQVSPKLYMAIGISGQIQHTIGFRNAEVVVAVNIDKGAPIFGEADYGVVGDLYQIVPEMIKQLKEMKKG